MEQAIISGIAHDVSEAKVTVRGVPDTPGVAAALFEPLAERSINVDMIVQNVSRDAATDISFTVPKEYRPHGRARLPAPWPQRSGRRVWTSTRTWPRYPL